MKDEIKEILEYIQKYTDEYETTNLTEIRALQMGYVDTVLLLDYITNLQEKIKQYEDPEDLTLFYMWLDEKAKDKMKQLQEENERLKQNLSKGITNNLENKYLNNKLYKDLEDYKTRNEKAIEYIENNSCGNLSITFGNELLEILKGGENNENRTNNKIME